MPINVSIKVASSSLQVKGRELRNMLMQHAGVDQLNYCSSSAKVEWHTFLFQAAAVETHKPGNNNSKFFDSLKIKLQNKSIPSDSFFRNEHSAPPFTSGWVGHLNYETAEWIENSLELHPAEVDMPKSCFRKYEASIAWHISSDTMWLFGNSKAAIDAYIGKVNDIPLAMDVVDANTEPLGIVHQATDSSASKFHTQVAGIKQRILAGDFFQANLTRMLSVDLEDATREQLGGFAERFLSQSQAPFGAILNFENATVISASPERFFRIEPTKEGRRIFSEPIKGTRPRHEDPVLDEAAKNELLSSEKDRAENIMIADLVRNDLSKVCTDESIIADPVCELRSFKNVHHLVTRVSGILKEEISGLDALLAQFPCGSITGAPKWAAMDAIAEIEQRGRGIYCGAIGYFDDRGHADFSIAIRTAVASFGESGTTLNYGTGGGITILSDPQEEFTETEDKAAGFLRALQA